MRVRPPSFSVLTASILAFVGFGCTLGPDPERPQTVADEAASYVHGEETTAEPWSPDSPWWQRFGDTATTDLVELALSNNTDLRGAAARVLEAQAALRQAGGTRYPQVSYGASGSRAKSSFVLPEIGRRSVYSTTFQDDLSVSWQIDLFGKLKRTRQSVWASTLAEEASRDAVMHSVVAQVVRARVQVASVDRASGIARDIRTSWESTLATVERRYRNGLVQAVDLHLARENLASARSAEVGLAAQAELARLALDVLVGRRPGSGPELPDTLPDLPNLDPVPMGLPIELLDRRPDLRQQEMQLAASTFGIGAALADLYPSLTLTASAGMTSDTLSDLASSDGLVYNAVVGLVGPLFTGGQRRGAVDAARARAEQSAAAYAGAILGALREVEDALVLTASISDQLGYTETRVAEARAANRISQERYQRGVESLLTVLETERRLRSAEEALITSKIELWNSRINLFLALGGDWELPAPGEEPETEAEVASTATTQTTQPIDGEVS